MKIIILIFIQLLFVNCHDATNNNNQKVLLNLKSHTLKLVEILSFNSVTNTSLFLKKDSALFVIPDHVKTPQYYQLRNFFYDSTNKKFIFKSILDLKPYKEINNNLYDSDHSAIKIKSIGYPMIKYSKLPDSLKKEKALRGILKFDTKIHLFKGEYIFLDKLTPRSIFFYNSITKKITSFDISEKYFEVTDFLVYDLDKDDNPEIFIFTIGNVPRGDIVSYTIYSIRKDSVNVFYE